MRALVVVLLSYVHLLRGVGRLESTLTAQSVYFVCLLLVLNRFGVRGSFQSIPQPSFRQHLKPKDCLGKSIHADFMFQQKSTAVQSMVQMFGAWHVAVEVGVWHFDIALVVADNQVGIAAVSVACIGAVVLVFVDLRTEVLCQLVTIFPTVLQQASASQLPQRVAPNVFCACSFVAIMPVPCC